MKWLILSAAILFCGCKSKPDTTPTEHKCGECCPQSKPDDKPKHKCGCPNCGDCDQTKKCQCDPVQCMDKDGCLFNCPGK